MRLVISLYIFLLLTLCVYSYGFIDPNFPLKGYEPLLGFAYRKREITTFIYSVLVFLLFVCFWLFLYAIKKKNLSPKQVRILIGLTIGILIFSFPAFSYDLFNYIATAKVAYLYKENPYIVMPIEIPNESMLSFLHAANKIALYGPAWIIMVAIPHFAGFGNLFLTMGAFKVFIAAFYVGLLLLLWKVSRSIWTLAFFGLNPLVTIETLVSGHNDVVMMFFAILSFLFLRERKVIASGSALLLSILIKYATLFLVPIYLYALYQTIRKREIPWQRMWFWSAILMYGIFFLSPLREETYSWYFIWILPFVALLQNSPLLFAVSLGFSFGLLFRVAPFFYTGSWGGVTPFIKKVVTFLPPLLAILGYGIKKKV